MSLLILDQRYRDACARSKEARDAAAAKAAAEEEAAVDLSDEDEIEEALITGAQAAAAIDTTCVETPKPDPVAKPELMK